MLSPFLRFLRAEYPFVLAASVLALLALTLALCMLTFGGRSTDLLKGAVHLVLFGVFLLLVIVP